ncbi:MAG: hypothetical protein MZW92_62405, partial [Comamonadaceae bacterium]|nr:hypothetical protein [Comamonadaceae bacterium]
LDREEGAMSETHIAYYESPIGILKIEGSAGRRLRDRLRRGPDPAGREGPRAEAGQGLPGPARRLFPGHPQGLHGQARSPRNGSSR